MRFRSDLPHLAVVVATLALASAVPVAAQTSRAPVDPAAALIGFGSGVAIAGDQVLIGRPGLLSSFPMPAAHAGAVHVFRRGEAGRWVEAAMFAPKDGAVGDGFGGVLAAEGNLVAVGAPEAGGRAGAVYIFERDGGGRWTQRARLAPAQALAGTRVGASLALQGGVLLAGAPGDTANAGRVVVFRRGKSSAEWSEEAVLRASASTPNDRFGRAVSLDRGRALVGAPGPGGNDSTKWQPGAAYVLRGGPGGWMEEAKLASDSAALGTSFAVSVLLDGDQALVGEPVADSVAGRVIVFRRGRDGRWTRAAVVAAAVRQHPAAFGASLARDGRDLLVGAPAADSGAGAVHVLRRGGDGNYTEAQRFGSEKLGFGTQLGFVLAAGNGIAAAGAPLASFFEGLANVYERDRSGGQWHASGTLTDTIGATFAGVSGGEVRCRGGKAHGFDCRDADLVSYLPAKALGAGRGVLINDLWGWTDTTTGREFALVGRTDGTAFVEVTDPANPVFLGALPLTEGARSNIWRDIKVYRNHAYIVADGAGPHGMQIFDLTQLRHVAGAPVTFKETAHYDRIFSAHNIVINAETGFAYTVGNSMGGETCGGGLHMVDIREPENPKFAGCQADPTTGTARTGYTHDAQCVTYHGPDEQYRGHELCFNASETALGIADVTDKNAPRALSTAAYPNVAYAHQGWLSEDHRYFFLDDEGDELAGTAPRTRTIVFDVTDLDDPVVAKEYFGETAASDHNLYVRGNYLYESNYVAGLRVLDIKDPVNPKEVGYFDTVPVGENAAGFAGSWSNYPFFKSGVVAVTSMREGLFLIRYQPTTTVP